MDAFPVYGSTGKKVDAVELSEGVFNSSVNELLVHRAVVMQRASTRQGNASTKGRGEVRGSGKKPWKQKQPPSFARAAPAVLERGPPGYRSRRRLTGPDPFPLRCPGLHGDRHTGSQGHPQRVAQPGQRTPGSRGHSVPIRGDGQGAPPVVLRRRAGIGRRRLRRFQVEVAGGRGGGAQGGPGLRGAL